MKKYIGQVVDANEGIIEFIDVPQTELNALQKLIDEKKVEIDLDSIVIEATENFLKEV